MMTEFARNKTALFLSQTYNTIQFGTGGDSSNPYVNSLDAPLIHTTLGTTNIMSNDTTIDFTYVLEGNLDGIAGQTIQEIGIFGNLPTNATQTGLMVDTGTASYAVEATMLFRIPIDPLYINTNESYDITITMEVM
tara:strand:- start:620 stop:1027 length:408 start_codon:yes stop_codon:yes gene_type:complete